MVRAIQVTNVLLAWANKNGDVVTNLKLQKLLYYAQAWYLVNFRRRLFEDAIEAWEFGPVIRDVYQAFKRHQSAPIPYRTTGREESALQSRQVDFLGEFYKVFSNLSATALVSMSHAEKPWIEAFVPDKNQEIDWRRMRDYYTERYNAQHHEN